MTTRSVQELKSELQKLAHHTPWEKIEVGETYHIPPIISLERRDILILDKDEDYISYKRIDDIEKKESKMHRTSVFSRFLVKRKSF